MFKFLNNLFAPRVNPIGIDFGTDCLRMAQVQTIDGEHHLAAAACADVPSHVRNNPQARLEFFVEAVRDLYAQGHFRGRQVVLSLPSSHLFAQHLRLPKLNEEETRKALPFEARGKLPIDPAQAILRHWIAGEVFCDNEPRNEVIVMAASRDFVNQLLASAAKAKLDVVGMNVEPKASLDCFVHVERRQREAELVTCYVDIGSCGTRAFVAEGDRLLFARSIPLGGDHFTRAVAEQLKIGFDDAKMLRLQLAATSPAVNDPHHTTITPPPAPPAAASDDDGENNSFALLGAALARKSRGGDQPAPATAAPSPAPVEDEAALQQRRVEDAVRTPVQRLLEELNLCRRYHEANFPNRPVQRVIFIGGEARQRSICQTLARQLGVQAQVGDALVRMHKSPGIGIESGIDCRQPQPGWSVAVGLSLGPKDHDASTKAA